MADDHNRLDAWLRRAKRNLGHTLSDADRAVLSHEVVLIGSPHEQDSDGGQRLRGPIAVGRIINPDHPRGEFATPDDHANAWLARHGGAVHIEEDEQTLLDRHRRRAFSESADHHFAVQSAPRPMPVPQSAPSTKRRSAPDPMPAPSKRPTNPAEAAIRRLRGLLK